jgi:hypothetical protein
MHCEEWTTAFLTGRHQALQDERERVPRRMRQLSIATGQLRIRGLIKEGRKQILNLVREGLESLHKIPPKTDADDRSLSNTNISERSSQHN